LENEEYEKKDILKDYENKYMNKIKKNEENENLFYEVDYLDFLKGKYKNKSKTTKNTNELKKDISEQRIKNDKLFSEIKDQNLIEESTKKYVKLLNEKELEIENLKKDNLIIKKSLEKQKKLNQEIKLIKEKELLDKDNKLKEVQEEYRKLDKLTNEINEKYERIEQIEINLKVKENEVIKSKNEIHKLNEQLKNNKKSIEELEKINIDLNQKISNKDKSINELKSYNSSLIEEMRAKDQIIYELNQFKKQKEIEYENIIKDYDNKEKNDENMNKKREIELDEREIKINNKEKELEDKRKLIEKENNEMKTEREKFAKDKDKNKRINKEINDLLHKKVIIEKELNEKNNLLIQMNNYMNNNMKYENIHDNSIIQINNNNVNNLYNSNDKNYIANSYNDILKSYKSPTLVGLNNIEGICFMNSILQCLSQTKILTNYFLDEKNKERIVNNNLALEKKSDTELSPAYLELLTKLWDKDGPKAFSPYNFMQTVEKINPLFKKGQTCDVKDFINFILEQLHKELKKTIYNDCINQPLNQYDKENSQNHFLNNFKKEGSILSTNFFGFNENITECLNCKSNSLNQGKSTPKLYNYGIFNYLLFPLEEIKYINNNNNQLPQNNIVTIYECFEYNQKSELLTGDNRNYCSKCRQLCESNYISRIFICPNILILILSRGNNSNSNIKLEFTERIDITKYVLKKDKPQLLYDLYAVVSHIGESDHNDHYVASCKSPVDNKWYRYNDDYINPITNLQKEVIDSSVPYVLFYQKV